MTNYLIFENGRQIEFVAKSTKQWKDTVRGLNLSMETIDAPYQEIIVKTEKNKIVFKQNKDPQIKYELTYQDKIRQKELLKSIMKLVSKGK